ncbi:MAG: DUF4252 domain-containing protein [Bacteroidota bacterium]
MRTTFYIALIVALALQVTCVTKSDFSKLYHEHKNEADLALTLPKWMAMIAVPSDAKEDIKSLTEGMKRIRVLYNNESALSVKQEFATLGSNDSYVPYAKVSSDGTKLDILALEDGEIIRELLIYIAEDDATTLLALQGKMPKKHLLSEADRLSK